MATERRIDWAFVGFALWMSSPFIALFAAVAAVDLYLGGVR